MYELTQNKKIIHTGSTAQCAWKIDQIRKAHEDKGEVWELEVFDTITKQMEVISSRRVYKSGKDLYEFNINKVEE